MKPIRVRFGIVHNTLFVQTVEMDDSLRGKLNFSAYGVTLKSANRPELMSLWPHHGEMMLYLNGTDKTRDGEIVCWRYKTRDEAELALDAFRKCIRKFNGEQYEQIEWEIIE